MIHLLLLICFSLPMQTPAPSVPEPPEALILVQSGIDAENRHDLDSAIIAFRKAADVARACYPGSLLARPPGRTIPVS